MPRIPDGYIPAEGGGYRLERFDACRNGHSPARPSWGACPHCRKMTMLWACPDPHCDGIVTAAAHQRVCGLR